MKKDVLISIIVPVYNAGSSLDKCVNSILNQTYNELELILVNDGSTDNSKKICEEYVKKDKRVKLINKENGGPGSAKNAGIENAKGKYIGFVDSDDYIENDMYEILYNLCVENNADISMIAFNKVINGKIIKLKNFAGETIIYDKLQAMKKLLLDNEIKNYSWNKLFKKELFNDIEFSEKIYYEDIDATIKLFEKSERIAYKKVCKYNYVQRSDSIVNCKSYDKLKDFVIVTKERYNYLYEKYNELNEYNAIGFVANMVLVYKYAVVYDSKELFSDFEKNYNQFLDLANRYEKSIFCELNNYRRLLLSIILWNVDLGKNVIKELEKQISEKIMK